MLASVAIARNVCAEPLRLRGDAIAETQSPAGLVVLQGEDKPKPWVSAEGLVWGGSRWDGATADVLVLAVKLREPHGYGDLRVGRFVVATGAIRPLAIDGASALARAPFGTNVEAFGGVPVTPRFSDRAYDWATGGRLSQSIAGKATIGASYIQRRVHGELADEEAGADVAIAPAKFLDLAAKGAYALDDPGIVDARVTAVTRFKPFRAELFAAHTSPSRLLPATSLFSVLGSYAADSIGPTFTWYAAPRLDLFAGGALQSVGGQAGGNGTVRAILRLDDRGDAQLAFEGRRQDVSFAQFTGARGMVTTPLGHGLRYATELEIAAPDHPNGRGLVWPWALMALSWRSRSRLELAAAVEAASTPQHQFETNALVRVGFPLEVP